MKKETRACLLCGHPVEFIHLDESDIGTKLNGIEINETMLGWQPAECEHCGAVYYAEDLIEKRMNGELEGFVASLETGEEIRHWLEAILTESPEAREIAMETLGLTEEDT